MNRCYYFVYFAFFWCGAPLVFVVFLLVWFVVFVVMLCVFHRPFNQQFESNFVTKI